MGPDGIDRLIPEERVPIRLVKERGRGWLALKNRVVLYGNRNPVSSEVHFYPVETVHILPPLRRLGKDVVQHMLIMLFVFLGTSLFLVYRQKFDVPSLIVMSIGGFLVLAILGRIIRSFLLGYPTSRLQFDTDGLEVEFWHRPGRSSGLDELLKEIRRLRHEVEIPKDFSQKSTTHVLYSRVWVALVFQVFMFSAPAIVLESPLFLLLLVIPLVQFAYMKLGVIKAPGAIRRALSLRMKKQYAEAEKVLNDYLETSVNDVNGWLLLTDIYIAHANLEEAEESCNAMRSLGLLEMWQLEELLAYIGSWRRVLDRLEEDGGNAVMRGEEVAEPLSG